ncbi:MAG: hypothetical protein SNJ64_03475 [Endomicrobiia bacterium]
MYKSEKSGINPPWTASSVVSLMELEGKITDDEYRQMYVFFAKRLGILFLVPLFVGLVITGLTPFGALISVLGGIPLLAITLIFGYAAIKRTGEVIEKGKRKK